MIEMKQCCKFKVSTVKNQTEPFFYWIYSPYKLLLYFNVAK